MATIQFKKGDDFLLKLERLERGADQVAGKAIYAGAKVTADQIKANIRGLKLSGENYDESYIKKDLEKSFGIASKRYEGSNCNVKLGFDGYGSRPTAEYPLGLPNQMIARAIESGTSFRPAKPFVRPAVNAARKRAVAVMRTVIDEEIKKTMK